MSTAAHGSDEQKCNEVVRRIVDERRRFGEWWRDWAIPRNVDTAYLREIAFEAWKAGRNDK